MKMDGHKQSDDGGENIGNRLCVKDAVQTPGHGKNENDGDKTDSLSQGAEDKTTLCFSQREEK